MNVSWFPMLVMKTKADQTKASPSLLWLWCCFSALLCSDNLIAYDWSENLCTWIPWTFCLDFTGIYFAFTSDICDFIISMSCHQIQKRFVRPLFMQERFFLGVASCSQTWKCAKHKTPAVTTYLPAVLKSSIYKTPGFK